MPVAAAASVVQADATGKLTLNAGDAELQGAVQVETKGGGENIGFWDSASDWVSWSVKFDKAGAYAVSLNLATVHEGATAVVEVGGQTLTVKLPKTDDWAKFQSAPAGTLTVAKPGVQTVKVRAADAATWKALNLRAVQLVPAN